jgi:hypothetical protein
MRITQKVSLKFWGSKMTNRATLPQRRYAETFELRHGNRNTPWQITVGYYPNGSIGEIFVTGAKSGSDDEANARDAFVALSISLQHGVPLVAFQHAMLRNSDGSASTIVGAVVDRLMEAK